MGPVPKAPSRMFGFSSPIQNYSFTMGNPIDIYHTLPHHERLAIYRTKFDDLAVKVEYLKNARIEDQNVRNQEKRQREKEQRQEKREREVMKREREQEKREREQEKRGRERDEKILLEYEVYDRIAQGLNDYLIDQLDALARGVVVASKVDYLPLLMTAWWFMSVMFDPTIYTLPNCLQDLPEDVTARFQNKKYKYLIDEDLDRVATILWNDYEQECLVMMACFTNRPSQRTPVAHRCPTVTAARAQIDNSSLFKNVALKNIALNVLKRKGLFDSTKGAAGI